MAELADLGPWSLETSRRFWDGFTPAALELAGAGPGLCTVFCAESGWRRAEAEVTQAGDTAHVVLTGDSDLDAAAAQVRRPPSRPGNYQCHPVWGALIDRLWIRVSPARGTVPTQRASTRRAEPSGPPSTGPGAQQRRRWPPGLSGGAIV